MKERPILPKSWLITITFVFLILAAFFNNYVLENWLFPGNTFQYFGIFFTAVELVFLTSAIQVLLSFKAIGLLFKIFFTKEVKYNSPGFKKELRQISLPIYPAMIIYGIFSGVIIYLLTTGCSFAMCILWATVLSTFWAMIYRYYWRKGFLVWLYDSMYQDAD